MEEPTEEQLRRLAQVLDVERPSINAAQRLAALDPDIRIAMSEVWWAALRVGLAIGWERPVPLPNDPFGAIAMDRAGFAPGDF